MHITRLNRFRYLIPILLLAFGLRVWGLAEHNIWWDEGIGVWVARLPLLEGIRWTATDSHPPLHYVILHLWRLVAGEGEYVLRFPSVVAGLSTVLFAFHLGRQLGGERTGILTALFVAVSRFSIMWSQEIRMYGLSATLATGSLAAAVWMWRVRSGGAEGQGNKGAGEQRSRSGFAWLAYVGATLGSLYTLYLTGTVVLVTNLGFLIVWWREKWNRKLFWYWASAHVVTVALFLPWALYALPRMHSLSTDEPFKPGFFLQLYATMLTVGTSLNLERTIPLVITVIVGMALGIILIQHRLTHRPGQATSVHIGGLTMMLGGLLLPPLAVVLVSLPSLGLGFSRSVAPRYLLPLSACYAVLLGWGIDSLAPRASELTQSRKDAKGDTKPDSEAWLWRGLAIGVAGFALVAAVAGLWTFYPGRARRDDYVTIAETLRANRYPQDAVVLYVDRDWPIFAAHYAGPRQGLPYGANLSDPAIAEAALAPIWESAAALWLVSTPESLQADPDQIVPKWLAAQAAVTRTLVSGENTLTLYARSELDAQVRETIAPGYTPPLRIRAPHSLVGADIPLPRYRTGDTLHLGLYWIPPLADGCRISIQNNETHIVFDVPPLAADLNIARNQVDIPLTPELPGGRYAIEVHVPGYEPTPLGTFTLIPKASGEATNVDTIPHRVDYRFGETIQLLGYALPATDVAPGEAVPLTLYWRTDSALSTRYKVFTHLLGERFNAKTGNFLWGQQDNEPGNGQDLTTLWAPGAIIVDNYRIPIDPQAPAGSYTIEIGVYGLVDGVRLPVQGGDGTVTDNAVHLATVVVSSEE
jgi:4-amino-4-deoxy-L-arabinose transferase-like glycosyltransferase